MSKKNYTAAEYLSAQIDYSDKTQTEIAKDLGYDKPNIITMFKQGKTKIPMPKVVPLAKSLGIDPLHMLRVVMQDYSPETWEVLENILGNNMVTEDEMKVIKLLREVAGEHSVSPETKDEVTAFKETVATWKKRTEAQLDASKRRKERSKGG